MEKPLAEFLAGTNGSGKSSLRGNQTNIKVIDPDAIAKKLNHDNSREMDLQAGREAVKEFKNCLKNKTPFSMETTLTGKSSIQRIQQAKDAGFLVSVKFIGLNSVDLNIDRVSERVKNGGHHIDETTIRNRYSESLKNLEKIIPIADNILIFDNSIKGENHKLYTIVSNNTLKTVNSPPEWISILNKKIEDILQTQNT